MSTTARVAAALLPYIDQPAAASDVLRQAEVGWQMSTSVPITAEAAAAELKGPVARVLTAANSVRDQSVLDRFAMDPRVTVQRVVAANPALGLEAARRLHRIAHKKGDVPILEAVLDKLPVAEILEARDGHTEIGTRFPSSRLVGRVRAEKDADAYRLLLASDDSALVSAAASDAYRGLIYDVDFDAAMALVRPELYAYAVGFAMSHAEQLDANIMSRFVSPEVRSRIWENFTLRRINGVALDADATRILLSNNISRAELRWLAGQRFPDETVTEVARAVIDSADNLALSCLVSGNGARLNQELAIQVVRTLLEADGYTADNSSEVVAHIAVDLPQDLVVRTLRRGTTKLLTRWIVGEAEMLPRPGECSALFADLTAMFQGVSGDPASHAAQLVETSITGVEGKPWEIELVDAASPAFLQLISRSLYHSRNVASYLARRFSAAFGDDPPLWQFAVQLILGWEGTLSDLLEASYLAFGRTPPWQEDEDLVELVVPPFGEQLALC